VNTSTTVATGSCAMASVTSRDGTTIGYRQVGHGPGLIVLHGAMESAQSHEQLADALAGTFTVYLPDRRGRGMSGPYRQNDGIRKDVEDLDAVIAKTGAHHVLGVSSGALICLEAARTLPAIRTAAIFEPPLMAAGQAPTALIKRFDEEIARGNVASALVTGMKAAQMGPAIFNLIPQWPLQQLTKMAMASEDKKAGPGHVSMRALAPTLHHDFQLIVETAGTLQSYGAVNAQVLLLGGDKSPVYLRDAVDALEKVLPNAKRVEFPGLNHGATGNCNTGGKPALVAQVLRQFLGDSSTEEMTHDKHS
jgi:pimeloyl-ACP methyl ester carboxylesterase